MIEGTILKNGSLRILLEGTDEIDEQVLKQLDGATCRLVTENFSLGKKNIAGCLMIQVERETPSEEVVETAVEEPAQTEE